MEKRETRTLKIPSIKRTALLNYMAKSKYNSFLKKVIFPSKGFLKIYYFIIRQCKLNIIFNTLHFDIQEGSNMKGNQIVPKDLNFIPT